MASYRYLDHTADILFQAEGASLEELFEQCALAVEDTQVHLDKVEQKKKVVIKGKSKSLENLLFDFLDDLLFYKDAEQLVFSRFEVSLEEKKGVHYLKCSAYGEKLMVEKHQPKVDVKAITMHMFEVKKIKGKWKAQVLVDI